MCFRKMDVFLAKTKHSGGGKTRKKSPKSYITCAGHYSQETFKSRVRPPRSAASRYHSARNGGLSGCLFGPFFGAVFSTAGHGILRPNCNFCRGVSLRPPGRCKVESREVKTSQEASNPKCAPRAPPPGQNSLDVLPNGTNSYPT